MRIALFAGSTRAGSINVALLRAIARTATERGHDVDVIDLADHPMPLFHADEEARDGVPMPVRTFVDKLRAADAVVIASPEYNGGFTPMLKNAIDWATRVEKRIWAEAPLALVSATPGGMGGRNGLSLLRTLFGFMGIEIVGDDVSIPKAGEAFDPEGDLVRVTDTLQVASLLDALEAAHASVVNEPAAA